MDIFEEEDYSDLTMQNVIEVIREGYKTAKRSLPDGIVQVFNISNVVQSKGEEAEAYHIKVNLLLDQKNRKELRLLQDAAGTFL